MSDLKKTIFLDIDGCIFKHHGNGLSGQIFLIPQLLPGVIDKLNKWEADGHKIILVTGRKESMRKITEEQLISHGVVYDQLIMGINRGERIIINDKKINDDESVAKGIAINRNEGLINLIL